MTLTEWLPAWLHILATEEFWMFILKTWFPAGIIAASVHHDFADQSVTPWGDPLARKSFWLLVITGWLGLLVALYSCYYVWKHLRPGKKPK